MSEPALVNPITIKELQYQFATSGVYVIYCTATDTYYIGEATVVMRRLVDHFTQLADGRHPNVSMQREYDAHGQDVFLVDLLADMPSATRPELQSREREEIQRFKLHYKRLYNKTGLMVGGNKQKPATDRSSSASGDNGNGPTKQTHAEKLREAESIEATCVDCGFIGYLHHEIFLCDDRAQRCQPCAEAYLEAWRLVLNQKPKKIVTGQAGLFRRYMVGGRMIVRKHEILLALNLFFERFGEQPAILYVNPETSVLGGCDDLEIIGRKITPIGYIDFPIGSHSGAM